MIYENDRDNFASVMTVTWQSYGRNKPDRETMRYWFDKLIQHDFMTVSNAFDEWLKSQKDMPTVANIIELCKPKPEFKKALPRPVDKEKNAEYADNVVNFIAENSKPSKRRDWVAYWENILAEPKKYQECTLRCARQALENLGKVKRAE